MARSYLYILLFVTLLLITGVAPAEGRELTVMTYNIKSGLGTDFKVDLDRIARIIRASGADLIGLQEVDRETTRVGGIDSVKYIAEKLGMNYVYGPNLAVRGGEYGNAILSKYPIRHAQNIKLSKQAFYEQRGFLLAEIEVGEHQLYFASTHLTHNSNKLRVKQVRDILEHSAKIKKPLIIVGDFNDHAVTTPIMLMTREFNDALNLARLMADYDHLSYQQLIDGHLTFPTTNPQSRIDYIFLSEELMLSGTRDSFRVIPSDGSDHLPVIARIVLPLDHSPQLDVGIVVSGAMKEWSKKLKLNYQEVIDNAAQLLTDLDYNYQVIEDKHFREIDLSGISLLLLADLRKLSLPEKYRLGNYLLQGGKVLALNQVGIKPEFRDSTGFLQLLGINYLGWNNLRPLHGFICKRAEHAIWQGVSDWIRIENNQGMVVGVVEESRVLGDWYNDFRAMPSHPTYKNGAIIETENSLYLAANLFSGKNYHDQDVQRLLSNCLAYLLQGQTGVE